ncbi:hypothetical protein BDD21_0018 [Thiocapsa rosea]|uniref:Type I restriction enzyme M protein n=2 Tax=Thiocapsa rosea TaxID=69360 RepID=A0A495V0F4_9GAMM|nr:hypothetical protein BDD21_0018 [Thiocapsa rosea]
MTVALLLDRCLTEPPSPTRSTPFLSQYQSLDRDGLLDCCLTGRRAEPAGPQPRMTGDGIDRETLDEPDGLLGKVGYEINFNRVFFRYQPPRPLAEIDSELAEVDKRILALLREVTE